MQDGDSDLEYEFEAFPTVSNEASAEAAAYVKSVLESNPAMESPKTTETLEQPVVISTVTDDSHDNLITSPEHHQGSEMRYETAEQEEEVRSILKAIAATGKFWYDWERFKNILSLHLKQVISEYPLTKMTAEEQKVALGETHVELVRRLDDALHSFVNGPPFTIQRLSEIILDAQSLYPNLSKLALALEKNLSVTSTLTISSDPHSSSPVTTPNGLNEVTDDPIPNTQMQSDNNRWTPSAPPVPTASHHHGYAPEPPLPSSPTAYDSSSTHKEPVWLRCRRYRGL